MIGKSKKTIFPNIQDKLWKKIKGWKEKLLSQTGKEILIKSVAQAILNCIMSCFKFQIAVVQKWNLLSTIFRGVRVKTAKKKKITG